MKKIDELKQVPHPDAGKPGYGPDGSPPGFWTAKIKRLKDLRKKYDLEQLRIKQKNETDRDIQ